MRDVSCVLGRCLHCNIQVYMLKKANTCEVEIIYEDTNQRHK